MNRFKHSTHSPELLAARDAVMQDIAELKLTEAWQLFCIEWAKRMIAKAEDAKGDERQIAHDVAVRACREARCDVVEERAHTLPQWFGPRFKRLFNKHWYQ